MRKLTMSFLCANEKAGHLASSGLVLHSISQR